MIRARSVGNIKDLIGAAAVRALRTARTTGLSSDCERTNDTPEIPTARADAAPNRRRRKRPQKGGRSDLRREGRRLQRVGRPRAVRAFGGRGASLTEMVILYQEMGRAESPQIVNRGGVSMLGPTLMKHSTKRSSSSVWYSKIFPPPCTSISQPGVITWR